MADPFEPYLKQADSLFASGDVVKAGQIWQAILKREPGHEEARAGLYRVKAHFDARATQDGLPAPEPGTPEPDPASDRHTLTPAPPELNTLLEAGCALYDAGLLPKAIATWEMALHQDPGNALARGYIDGARRKLEAEAAPPPQAYAAPAPGYAPQAPAAGPDEEDALDKLLRDGCTLFDMGQTEDALGKWERILAVDPGHALALAYVADARRELNLPPRGGAPSPAGTEAMPAAIQAQPGRDPDGTSRAAQLVREAVQIYDMGMYAEAVQKWQAALALDPSCPDAQGYLDMAARDRDQAPPGGAPRPEPPRPAPPDPLEAQLAAAENLLRNQRFEEAAFSFQRLLEAGVQDPRVLQGYQHARAFLNAQEPATAPTPAPAAPPPPLPVAVNPPRAVSAPRPPARGGLRPPRFLNQLRFPAWLGTPRSRFAAGAGILAVVLGLGLLRAHQRDLALRDAVASAKANALAPVARNLQIAPLTETPQAIRAEAERAVADDPLTGYYRAQECLRLDPADAAAAQLLERARARMAATAPVGSGADLDKSMKAGDLESSRTALGDQLRANPDDPELKAKARIIYLALAQSLAGAEKYSEARELLLQGRAMYPQDKTWQARLKLLEEIQGMAKADRPRWIPLLG